MDEARQMGEALVVKMWSRCERVARRGFYQKVWRGGFLTGAVVTLVAVAFASVARFLWF